MELPILCHQIFQESLTIFHFKIEFVVLYLNGVSILLSRIVLQNLLELVDLTSLEFIVLSVFFIFKDFLRILREIVILRNTNLFFNTLPFNHLIAVLQLVPKLLFLLENTGFERI